MRGLIDRLEARQLLNAYGKYDAKGVFRIFGTAGDDRIEITFEPQYGMTDSATGDGTFIAGYSPKVTANGQPLRILGKWWAAYPRPVRLYLGAGNDTLTITNPTADAKGHTRFIVEAGDGNDDIDTGIGNDTIFAGTGNDTVNAGAGNDSIDGSSGADDLRAGSGDNTVIAGGGNDRIRHGAGNDSVSAGAGDDRFFTGDTGDTGVTTLDGGSGNDTLISGSSRDAFTGGDGDDVADYRARSDDLLLLLERSSTPVDADRLVPGLGENQPRFRNNRLWDDGRATLNETDATSDIPYGATAPAKGKPIKNFLVPDDQAALYGTGRLEGDSLIDIETVFAGSGDDAIVGTEARDILRGGAGNDTIFAGGGQDDLYGDAGDDAFFTVDSRDGMPWIMDETGRMEATDLVDGGTGKDFARFDARDSPGFRSRVETLEPLAPLYS